MNEAHCPTHMNIKKSTQISYLCLHTHIELSLHVTKLKAPDYQFCNLILGKKVNKHFSPNYKHILTETNLLPQSLPLCHFFSPHLKHTYFVSLPFYSLIKVYFPFLLSISNPGIPQGFTKGILKLKIILSLYLESRQAFSYLLIEPKAC